MTSIGTVLVVALGVALVAVCLVAFVAVRRTRARSGRVVDELAVVRSDALGMIDDLPDAVFRLDDTDRVVAVNERAALLLGCSADELVDRPFSDLVVEGDATISTGSAVALRCASGRAVPVEMHVHRSTPSSAARHAQADDPASPGDAVVIVRRIDEERDDAAELDAARRRFQHAFHSAPTGMALVRLRDNRIVDANRALADMLDHSRQHLVGRSIREFIHPDDFRATIAQQARLELSIDLHARNEQRLRRRDGSWIWTITQVALTADDAAVADDVSDGATSPDDRLAITHIEDITQQREQAARLRHAASHDSLTDLPNRATIVRRLDALLVRADLDEIGVMFIDLDNFKNVNDSLGHAVGDRLLREIADRFRSVMRDGDQVARIGGDEFVVIVDGSDNEGSAPLDVGRVADRLLAAMREPVVIDGHEIVVTASIGVATNDRPDLTADRMLRDSDAAMYVSKSSGRDRVTEFDGDQHRDTAGALETTADLRRAIANDEIVPIFQPIVDLTPGRVGKLEVLARWDHPERGIVEPDAFLPIADAAGLLVELGERLLRDSLAVFSAWRVESPEVGDVQLSINLAARQLASPDFVGVVRDALTTTGVEADAVWDEIPETALLSDVATATTALRELRNLGVHLTVDDFGTGYSSLTYLKHFPVEELKVDRSFVHGLGIEANDTTIVSAVVHLGHALGLTVTAEGVETELQLARLRDLGCDRVQGHLVGRAVRATDLRSGFVGLIGL